MEELWHLKWRQRWPEDSIYEWPEYLKHSELKAGLNTSTLTRACSDLRGELSLSITGGQEPAPAAACAAACGGRAQPGSAPAPGIHLRSLSVSLHAPRQCCNFTYWSARWVIMPKCRQVSAFQIKCCYLIRARQSKRVCLAPGLDTGRRRFLVRRNERLVLRQKPHLMERNWCYLHKSTGWLWSQMFPSVYDKSIVLQCCRKSQISLLSLLLPESSQLTSGK